MDGVVRFKKGNTFEAVAAAKGEDNDSYYDAKKAGYTGTREEYYRILNEGYNGTNVSIHRTNLNGNVTMPYCKEGKEILDFKIFPYDNNSKLKKFTDDITFFPSFTENYLLEGQDTINMLVYSGNNFNVDTQELIPPLTMDENGFYDDPENDNDDYNLYIEYTNKNTGEFHSINEGDIDKGADDNRRDFTIYPHYLNPKLKIKGKRKLYNDISFLTEQEKYYLEVQYGKDFGYYNPIIYKDSVSTFDKYKELNRFIIKLPELFYCINEKATDYIDREGKGHKIISKKIIKNEEIKEVNRNNNKAFSLEIPEAKTNSKVFVNCFEYCFFEGNTLYLMNFENISLEQLQEKVNKEELIIYFENKEERVFDLSQTDKENLKSIKTGEGITNISIKPFKGINITYPGFYNYYL